MLLGTNLCPYHIGLATYTDVGMFPNNTGISAITSVK